VRVNFYFALTREQQLVRLKISTTMNNSGASLIFIHNNIDYYALSEVLPDHKKILSFGNDLLQEVKIIGENSPVQVLQRLISELFKL
jgi:hypothetical protein